MLSACRSLSLIEFFYLGDSIPFIHWFMIVVCAYVMATVHVLRALPLIKCFCVNNNFLLKTRDESNKRSVHIIRNLLFEAKMYEHYSRVWVNHLLLFSFCKLNLSIKIQLIMTTTYDKKVYNVFEYKKNT